MKFIVLILGLLVFLIEAIFLVVNHTYGADDMVFMPILNLHYHLFYVSIASLVGWLIYWIMALKSRFLQIISLGLLSISFVGFLIVILVSGDRYFIGAPYAVSVIRTDADTRYMLARDDFRNGVLYGLWRQDLRDGSQMMWHKVPVGMIPAPHYSVAGNEILVSYGDYLFVKRQSLWTDCVHLPSLMRCYGGFVTSPSTDEEWFNHSDRIRRLLPEGMGH